MTHGRKPRRPRYVAPDPFRLARNSATRLTPAEIADVMTPLRAAARSLREGVGTKNDWIVVASTMNIAQAIERQAIVRGLREHLHAAEIALQAIETRALASGTWCATALHWHELDAITTAVDLHEFQMQQLAYGEFRRAILSAQNEVRSTGGRTIQVRQAQEALL